VRQLTVNEPGSDCARLESGRKKLTKERYGASVTASEHLDCQRLRRNNAARNDLRSRRNRNTVKCNCRKTKKNTFALPSLASRARCAPSSYASAKSTRTSCLHDTIVQRQTADGSPFWSLPPWSARRLDRRPWRPNVTSRYLSY
jgi:hypothetical protein